MKSKGKRLIAWPTSKAPQGARHGLSRTPLSSDLRSQPAAHHGHAAAHHEPCHFDIPAQHRINQRMLQLAGLRAIGRRGIKTPTLLIQPEGLADRHHQLDGRISAHFGQRLRQIRFGKNQ